MYTLRIVTESERGSILSTENLFLGKKYRIDFKNSPRYGEFEKDYNFEKPGNVYCLVVSEELPKGFKPIFVNNKEGELSKSYYIVGDKGQTIEKIGL